MSRPELIICSSPELTDDESERPTTSYAPRNQSNISEENILEISSDEDDQNMSALVDEASNLLSEEDAFLISSDDSLEPSKPQPKVAHTNKQTKSKSSIIDSLFSKQNGYTNVWISAKPSDSSKSNNCNRDNINKSACETKPIFVDKFPQNLEDIKAPLSSPINLEEKSVVPQHRLNIGGVEVHFPVKPYSCQIALMFKVITGISKKQNCLLESPTGTGKTLALLCGALAWQSKERARIAKDVERQYFSEDIDLEPDKDEMPSPDRSGDTTLEEPFKRTLFGERSIYESGGGGSGDASPGSRFKRPEALRDLDTSEEGDQNGLVTIHKRRKLGDITPPSAHHTPAGTPQDVTSQKVTPQKVTNSTPKTGTPEQSPKASNTETPKSIRLPRIYYGARTHKQIQQVVKEFKRTVYAGKAKMSILSSREYSCIRDVGKDETYTSKNDMCRDVVSTKNHNKRTGEDETLCSYFDNRRALVRSGVLPPAWDLEDLVSKGREICSCPYYGARAIAENASIIFCPYNYLIDPGIRNSLQLDMESDIVILDEAHNIEDVCRDAASLTLTAQEVLRVINELESQGKYMQNELGKHVDLLLRDMQNWEYWFHNQKPLLKDGGGNMNETVHTWSGSSFAKTLEHHNIGYNRFHSFVNSVNYLSNAMRDSSTKLYGITSATVAILDGLATTLGYMFRDACAFIEDFKPTLVRTTTYVDESPADARGWRSSQYKTREPKEVLSLRLLCMNPALVFSALQIARSIVLSSGTLTPMSSLHSELGCTFPLVLSANHVIPDDRVWVGSLLTCPDGTSLECTSRGSDKPSTQDALGNMLLYVCSKTPNGVLCFLPSYMLMNKLAKRWQETKIWQQLNDTKHVFMEARNVRDHSEVMEDYYSLAGSKKGALLIAVYRGKVSEGMDFKDEQARAVITIGIPYPNTFESMVSNKMKYNDANQHRQLLPGREWLRVQAYRALNQAVGRCVRHARDWGAVLLVDCRFQQSYYTEHLSKWLSAGLSSNQHTWSSLVNRPDSLESFMQNMTIRESEEC